MVVVREPTGILRHADHEERQKMLNVYFHPDRPNYTPKMFEPLNLEVRPTAALSTVVNRERNLSFSLLTGVSQRQALPRAFEQGLCALRAQRPRVQSNNAQGL